MIKYRSSHESLSWHLIYSITKSFLSSPMEEQPCRLSEGQPCPALPILRVVLALRQILSSQQRDYWNKFHFLLGHFTYKGWKDATTNLLSLSRSWNNAKEKSRHKQTKQTLKNQSFEGLRKTLQKKFYGINFNRFCSISYEIWGKI